VRGRGIILNEPSVVATNAEGTRIIAVGKQAREMVGRTPGSIVAIRPMRDGVIADYVVTEGMLRHFIERACGRNRLFKPDVMISIPSGLTGVERRAVQEAAQEAGAKWVHLIEEPLAAAIGADLPIAMPSGSMIADIGGGTTEIAVISLGGTVVSNSIRVGGNRLDESIITYVKRKHNLMIGEPTAEHVKIQVGTAVPLREELSMKVRGRDLAAGLPRDVSVTSAEVREAIAEPLNQIATAIRAVLEQTPPELSADILDKGIVLSGGASQLRGLDKYISSQTGIPAVVAENPQECVALGTGLALDNFDVLRSQLTSIRS
jgi:rod shape-determining protein MreB